MKRDHQAFAPASEQRPVRQPGTQRRRLICDAPPSRGTLLIEAASLFESSLGARITIPALATRHSRVNDDLGECANTRAPLLGRN